MHDQRFSQVETTEAVEVGELPFYRRFKRQRLAALTIAFITILLATVFAAQAGINAMKRPVGAEPSQSVNADSAAVLIVRPNEAVQYVARSLPVAAGIEQKTASEATFSIPEDSSTLAVNRMKTSAALSKQNLTATSEASIEHIELLAGRISIDTAKISAKSSVQNERADGEIQLTNSTHVTVNGKSVNPTPNKQIVIENVGTLLLNEQAVLSASSEGDKQTGPRFRVVGAIAHLRITADNVEGLPKGSEVVIGRVDAGVREGKIEAITPDKPQSNNPSTPNPYVPLEGHVKPGLSTLPRKLATTKAIGSAPTQSLQRYIFPVLGATNYSNDWGGPRASTGIPHQGTDIFASLGTPVVAVADGVLDRVGWNTIGGYRFWLFDKFGNSFYHAHLSAYAPLARDGAFVRAGDVIGFVGHTGDAEGTPSHLHFEIHPSNAEPTNPFPFLNAWKKGVAVAISMLDKTLPSKPAASTLLTYSDISPNSGLQDSVTNQVPQNTQRPIEDEYVTQPNDKTLSAAINGSGTTAAK